MGGLLLLYESVHLVYAGLGLVQDAEQVQEGVVQPLVEDGLHRCTLLPHPADKGLDLGPAGSRCSPPGRCWSGGTVLAVVHQLPVQTGMVRVRGIGYKADRFHTSIVLLFFGSEAQEMPFFLPMRTVSTKGTAMAMVMQTAKLSI